MYLTIHSATGLIVGKYINNFFIGIIVGYVIHLFFDAIPHGDQDLLKNENENKQNFDVTKKQILIFASIAAIDFTIAISIIAFLYFTNVIELNEGIIGTVAGSMLPDFLFGGFLLTKNKILEKLTQLHVFFHTITKKRISFKNGMILQMVLLILLLTIIYSQ